MENSFSFFAPAYILGEKEVLRKGGRGQKIYKVGGVITTEDKDRDGDIILTKGLDLSYFTGGWGKIKYEHDDGVIKEPDNIIGFPTKVIKKSNRVEFEGELIPFDPSIPDEQLTPQQKNVKSAVGLLEAIEEYNKRHPDKPQKVGWSIEGEFKRKYRDADGKILKASIVNVVLTTKPRNASTFATLIKSLEVGYGVTPETQTGLGATRKESLEKNVKQFYKEKSKMEFKSFDEAKKYFLSQGLSEEEAEKKAKEVMEKMNNPEPQKENAGVNELKKSIQLAEAVIELQPDINTEQLTQKITKSVQTMERGENIDLTSYFEAKQETDLSLLEATASMVEKQDLLAKSLVALAKGLVAVTEENEKLKKSISFIEESQKLNNQALIKSLKARADFSFAPSDLIQNVDYAENNNTDDITKLNKSTISNALFDLYKEGKVSGNVVSSYEGLGVLDDNVVPLVKAKVLSKK